MIKSPPVVIIPAFQPSKALTDVVFDIIKQLPECPIIIINDGSSPEYTPVFEQLKSDTVTVLTHTKNMGKGAALKTGFCYWQKNYPHSQGIITADADGQHVIADIKKITHALQHDDHCLYLGVRNFKKKSVPLRSRLGNIVTRFCVKQYQGLNITDTQTGLRGLPRELINNMLHSHADGYEFELEMLLNAANNKMIIQEIPIQTRYIDHNASSHFNPLLDSLKIYFVFIRFSAISLLSAALDFSIFFICFHLGYRIADGIIWGRIISGVFNFSLNKRLAFKVKKRLLSTLSKYCILAITLATLAYTLISIFYDHTHNIYLSKLAGELLTFSISFVVQRYFIF